MAKACDRCGKPIGKYGLTVKIKGTCKIFITDIDRVFRRYKEGHPSPEYDAYSLKGEKEFCENCLDSYVNWLSGKWSG